MAWVARILVLVFGAAALGYAAWRLLPPETVKQVTSWLGPIGGLKQPREARPPLTGGENPRDELPGVLPEPRELTEIEQWRALPKVLLDPGHGGSDPGTSAEQPYEKTLVLDLALRVARLLRERGIPVELTRTEDVHLELAARVAVTMQHPQALFVSLHMNGGTDASWNGVETFWYSGQAREMPEPQVSQLRQRSRRLANLVHEGVASSVEANDRGVKENNLQVVREPRIPAVLVECGFLSNRRERNRLESKDYREKLAAGIAGGIARAWEEKLMEPPEDLPPPLPPAAPLPAAGATSPEAQAVIKVEAEN